MIWSGTHIQPLFLGRVRNSRHRRWTGRQTCRRTPEDGWLFRLWPAHTAKSPVKETLRWRAECNSTSKIGSAILCPHRNCLPVDGDSNDLSHISIWIWLDLAGIECVADFYWIYSAKKFVRSLHNDNWTFKLKMQSMVLIECSSGLVWNHGGWNNEINPPSITTSLLII